MAGRPKGSVVLTPQQAKMASSVLSSALARQSLGGDMQANGLYGSIYQFPNYGRYRPRFYTEQDTEQGLDSLSRQLLVRWSREMMSQQGWIESAVRILADFSVGDAYQPEYTGDQSQWWEVAQDWLLEEYFPNLCNRGPAFDFNTIMHLGSEIIDIDGDFLIVKGQSNGFPKIQILPSHRINSSTSNDNSNYGEEKDSPFPNTIMSDGVIYDMSGRPMAYQIINPKNMVNSLFGNNDKQVISAQVAHLVYDPRFFDKGRGRPTIGSAILQAMSLQEIESYLMEKIKIESCVGLVEKTQSGEGPMELQATLQALAANGGGVNGLFTASPQNHGVQIVDGPTMRYVKSSGGDIKTLASTTPANETSDYISRLEQSVLSTLGVPHALLLSPDSVSGRISDGIGEIFNRAVKRRQKILDKAGKLIIAYGLAVAMKNKIIPPNYSENLFKVICLTHPNPFSLNKGYDDKAKLELYKAGASTLDDLARDQHTTASAILEQREKEATDFLTRAVRISKSTGVDLPIVLQTMRDGLAIKPTASHPSGDQI